MMYCKKIKIIFFLCVILGASSSKFSSLDIVYQKGLDAYTNERWSECIVQFEESLHLYKLYKSVIINCRLKCKNDAKVSNIQENIEDLKIYELYFKTRQCLINCKQEGFDHVHMFGNVSETIISNMKMRKPYEYLHLCYFQMYALPKAASASYTFLVGNPGDTAMKKNLDYYTQQPEVDINNVVDLESEDYQILYRLGLKSYISKLWDETIANMEEALIDYFAWENKCRMECEHQPEQDWSPEVSIIIANYIASLLTCKQRCQDQLQPLYNSGRDFLADVLNYLQISYYHLDRLDDVGKAVASYLSLLPDDEDMLENKRIYRTLIDKNVFLERSDIIHYIKRDKYEKQLLEFFHQDDSDRFETNLVL